MHLVRQRWDILIDNPTRLCARKGNLLTGSRTERCYPKKTKVVVHSQETATGRAERDTEPCKRNRAYSSLSPPLCHAGAWLTPFLLSRSDQPNRFPGWDFSIEVILYLVNLQGSNLHSSSLTSLSGPIVPHSDPCHPTRSPSQPSPRLTAQINNL